MMNIGADYSFLSVKRVGRRGPRSVWRFEAAVLGPGWLFTADHEQERLASDKKTLKQIAEFAARKTRRLKLVQPDGGWLRVTRDRSDRIPVRYRVCHASTGTSLEGKVGLTGEPAEVFCRQLGGRS